MSTLERRRRGRSDCSTLKMKSGYFAPDASRAGRFDRDAKLVSADFPPYTPLMEDDEMDLYVENEPPGESVETGNQESKQDETEVIDQVDTSSSSESDSESLALGEVNTVIAPPELPQGYKFVQHRRTKTMHLVDLKFHLEHVVGDLLMIISLIRSAPDMVQPRVTCAGSTRLQRSPDSLPRNKSTLLVWSFQPVSARFICLSVVHPTRNLK